MKKKTTHEKDVIMEPVLMPGMPGMIGMEGLAPSIMWVPVKKRKSKKDVAKKTVSKKAVTKKPASKAVPARSKK